MLFCVFEFEYVSHSYIVKKHTIETCSAAAFFLRLSLILGLLIILTMNFKDW